MEIQRSYIKASLINRLELAGLQDQSDVMAAHRLVKQAFNTDVTPILCEARMRKGGALHPFAAYRASGYRNEKAKERPAVAGSSSGIV